MSDKTVRVGQIWRRVKGTRSGTLVRVEFVDNHGVSWRRVLAPHTHGGLFTRDWRNRYEFVEEPNV